MASNINFLFTFCSWTSDNLIFQEADTNIKLILAKLPMCEPFISVTRWLVNFSIFGLLQQ